MGCLIGALALNFGFATAALCYVIGGTLAILTLATIVAMRPELDFS